MNAFQNYSERLLAFMATNTKKLIGVTVAGTLLAVSYLQFNGKLDPVWEKLTPSKAVAAEMEPAPPEPDVPTLEVPVVETEVLPVVEVVVEEPEVANTEEHCPSGTLNLLSTSGEHIGCILQTGDRSNQ